MRTLRRGGSFFLSIFCAGCVAACSGSDAEPSSPGTGGSAGTQSSSGGAGGGSGGSFAGSGGSLGGSGGSSGGSGGSFAGSGGSLGGTGGSSGGSAGSAGTGGSGGSNNPDSELGKGTMEGSGSSSERYATGLVSRSGVPYAVITNGWGPGFDEHTISWLGTSFVVESMEGQPGSMGQPASFPAVFCGRYSVQQVPNCGLPAPRSSIDTLRTGFRWAANGNTGEYNASYDIWVGNGTMLQGYLMVWLRDPPGQQPAGQPNPAHQNVTVQNVPGTWNIWNGTVNSLPIINWVKEEGADISEIEFDVMDFVRDAEMRGLTVPGTHINSVAAGFEIWEGPIENLEVVDFYVHVN